MPHGAAPPTSQYVRVHISRHRLAHWLAEVGFDLNKKTGSCVSSSGPRLRSQSSKTTQR
jgi:hypothetical protein